MSEVSVQFELKMKAIVERLTGEYFELQVGRANPAILEKIMVDYYGVPTPLNQMAAIGVAEARILVVQPWDKSCLKEIERAIQASDIGINPTNDGNILRIAFPQLSEDRRKEICKNIHKMAEETKIAIRGARREGMDEIKKLKKANEITEDEQKIYEKDIQDLTDKFCKQIDELAQKKEKETMVI